MTVREAIAWSRARLCENSELREHAALDADLLLRYALHMDKASLLATPERILTNEEESHFSAMIVERLRSVPIQYITGEQEFYGLRFRVTPDVLIPRPETELLVESVLSHLDPGCRIADIGTGSGAIAVALASKLPTAQIVAVDISAPALILARENAEANGVAAQICFVESDLLDAVAGEKFEAIVSNPPYIANAEIASLHPQVREHEPHTALLAGNSGFEIYERLIPQAAQSLRPGGLLAMEMGAGQHNHLAEMLSDWNAVEFLADLQGITRVVLARNS
jgi:release factor glutamine methyltransferase